MGMKEKTKRQYIKEIKKANVGSKNVKEFYLKKNKEFGIREGEYDYIIEDCSKKIAENVRTIKLIKKLKPIKLNKNQLEELRNWMKFYQSLQHDFFMSHCDKNMEKGFYAKEIIQEIFEVEK